jgi:hypothetical protein
MEVDTSAAAAVAATVVVEQPAGTEQGIHMLLLEHYVAGNEVDLVEDIATWLLVYEF